VYSDKWNKQIILEILLAVNSNDIHILFKKYSSKEVEKRTGLIKEERRVWRREEKRRQ
jgi:hypothetical protein